MVGWVLLAAALFVAVSAAPAAMASLTVTVDVPKGFIKPEIETGKVVLNLTLDCQTALKFVPAVNNPIQFSVTWDSASPSNVMLNGPSVIPLKIDGCQTQPTGSVTQSVPYTVGVTRNAPGMESLAIRMIINCNGKEADGTRLAPVETNFTVKADYFPLVQAKVNNNIVEGAPGTQVPFQIELSNLGNAATTVTFSQSLPTPDARWNLTLPAAVTLDTPNKPGAATNATVIFLVTTPAKSGWNNEDAVFTIVMTPASALDSGKTGEPITISVLVRDRGNHGTPSVGPLGLITLLALAAVVRRGNPAGKTGK